jgi:hypothetical protein
MTAVRAKKKAMRPSDGILRGFLNCPVRLGPILLAFYYIDIIMLPAILRRSAVVGRGRFFSMSHRTQVLINKDTKVIVQGFTGKQVRSKMAFRF